MNIFRYTADIQAAIAAKTKPEPWLHIAISDKGYDIYVWDTRQVLESGKLKGKVETLADHYKLFGRAIDFANDNLEPLQGKCVNDWVGKLGKWYKSNTSKLNDILRKRNLYKCEGLVIRQGIYSMSQFDNEKWPCWQIGCYYTRQKAFHSNTRSWTSIVSIIDEQWAETTMISGMNVAAISKRPEYADKLAKFNGQLAMLASIGFEPDKNMIHEDGAQPMSGVVKL